jgi:hypothetical protein
MEEVKILRREPANILLFNAICAVCSRDELMQTFNITGKCDATTATVQVLVNGVEVPFAGALDKAVEDILSGQKDRIREEAVKLLTESPLADLYATIQDAEAKIRSALRAAVE